MGFQTQKNPISDVTQLNSFFNFLKRIRVQKKHGFLTMKNIVF